MVCQAWLTQTLDSQQMDPSTDDPPTMAMWSEVAGWLHVCAALIAQTVCNVGRQQCL